MQTVEHSVRSKGDVHSQAVQMKRIGIHIYTVHIQHSMPHTTYSVYIA